MLVVVAWIYIDVGVDGLIRGGTVGWFKIMVVEIVDAAFAGWAGGYASNIRIIIDLVDWSTTVLMISILL